MFVEVERGGELGGATWIELGLRRSVWDGRLLLGEVGGIDCCGHGLGGVAAESEWFADARGNGCR